MLYSQKAENCVKARVFTGLLILICITALLPQIWHSLGNNEDAMIPVARRHLLSEMHQSSDDSSEPSAEVYQPFESCDYVQLPFSLPKSVPSCTWVSLSSSESLECVNATTVRKVVYNATGCSQGSGTVQTEDLIVNGQNGAVVDCSKNKECSAEWTVAESITCPLNQTISLSSIKSIAKRPTGLCFDLFGGPKLRYGCSDNSLVTDLFEATSCTSTAFHRTQTKSCYASSSSITNVFSCSGSNTEPPEFPEPNVERKTDDSCGSLSDPKSLFQLDTCYTKWFQLPVVHSCRNNGQEHVETMYDGNNCTSSVVSEMIIPTEQCINGKFLEKCEGELSSTNGTSGIPSNDGITARVYGSGSCNGTGVGVTIRKDFEFSFGFRKVKIVCSNGTVEEITNSQVSATFGVGRCQSLTGASYVGKSSDGFVSGQYVKFMTCP